MQKDKKKKVNRKPRMVGMICHGSCQTLGKNSLCLLFQLFGVEYSIQYRS